MSDETWESEIDLNDTGTTTEEDLQTLASALQQELTPEAFEALVENTSLADLLAVDVTQPTT